MSSSQAVSRLGVATKVSYGLGSVAQAVSGVALAQSTINFFLIRVLGLRPSVVGLVILVSLAIDAVFDPVIGRVSDVARTPWGRRHPFMYASALPIALAIYFLWRPPHDLSPDAVAIYTLVLLIVLRLCASLYQIPSDALTPELAPDYHDRTSLISYRYFFGFLGGTTVAVILQTVFLRKDASHPLGALDREAYAQFGLMAAIVTFLAILISSAATHRYIRRLWIAPVRRQSFLQALREVLATLGNPSLVVVMGAGLLSGIAVGISASINTFMSYYFWGLTPQTLGVLTLFVAPSFVVGVVLAPILSRALDKKWTTISVFAASILAGVIPVTLRLVGLMPPNGSPWVPVILVVDSFFSQTLSLTGFIIVGSMIADVAEDNAVKTGARSEGLLFAASNLLPKFTAGIGGLVGAFMLELANFPVGAQGASVVDYVDPAIMRHLALLSLPAGMALNFAAVGLLFFYRLDRGSHEANLEALAVAAQLGEPPTTLPAGAAASVGEPL